MIGTGLTPEGIEQNDMMYEMMNEMGYRTKALNSVELEDWIKYYALRRYGGTNDNIVKAWNLLIHSVLQLHVLLYWLQSPVGFRQETNSQDCSTYMVRTGRCV